MKISRIAPVGLLALALVATGCSSGTDQSSGSSSADTIQLTNCGETKQYPSPTTRLFVNDGNIISIALAAGAADEIVAVSSLQRDRDVLALKYGAETVDGLNQVAEKYPTMENIVAASPQVVFAGWGYGFSEEKNLTPDGLSQQGIESYLLSETCRQDDGNRGTMDPWDALTTDITNVGAMTGHEETAESVVADINDRRQGLEQAPQADTRPTAFLFDSSSDTIFSSGSFGAPQAMMDSAGVTNALADVEDTWTSVSWERLATADPDIIFFVDYPGQSYDEKIAALRSNDATKNLRAVKEERFVNLPYAMWTSGPLNIDGAEYLRTALEHYGLQPASDVRTQLDLSELADLPGNEWMK
ncbi:ABC transporter substrate-binding protein [Propionibacterium australiense]|uniref:ABC transporter periplasmic binding domain n=1 Tax=Propionibacterium australiense TaxID=119981 RepID=A0A383S6R4_9ACTN|nr:ABC transporter substrate-binding protein [Propionibacterium australiense]RLP07678.1 iron transporter [Propionibacterium australiense]RLP08105.1 iron transporter [Propionibacterium australiense]SYZ33690.1 ABC transporter periplasmic binding domain [Propionibacterium australiense]VEH92912.1 ABC-type hemin transport system, periplasmic component [Propionibacterium australiense]